MLEVGFGHKAPANAVRDALNELYPGRYSIKVVDFAREVGASREDRMLKDGWDLALAFPFAARIGYHLMEKQKSSFYLDIIYKDFIGKGMLWYARQDPDLVFATHPLCLYIAGKAREEYGLRMKIIAYVVDPFDGYSLWADERADRILVASEESKNRLMEHGIDESRILLTGFPTNKKFFNVRKSREEIQSELGLDPAKPTMLVSCGGQGIGNVFLFLLLVAKAGLPLNIVTIAGKNKSTKAMMDRIATVVSPPTRLVSLGYVNNMNEIITGSDFIAGKAGASTFMEAVFMGKPMVFTEWATYNDWYIVNYALEHDIGLYCSTPLSFSQAVANLVQPGALEGYVERIEKLAMRPGADDVARYLAELLDRLPA